MFLKKLIKIENLKNRLEILNSNKHLINLLSVNELEFSRTLEFAIINSNNNNDHYLKIFSDSFVQITITCIISKPSDLISCLRAFKKKKESCIFLNLVVRHSSISQDFLSSLGGDIFVFDQLPKDYSWVEVPINSYAADKLKIKSGQIFEVNDLLPLGIEISLSTSEHVLSWAFEEDALSSYAIEFFKENFPKKYDNLYSMKNNR